MAGLGPRMGRRGSLYRMNSRNSWALMVLERSVSIMVNMEFRTSGVWG